MDFSNYVHKSTHRLPLIQLVLILINMLIALYAFGFDPKGLTLGAIIDNGQIHCDTNLGHPISSGRNVTRPEIDYTCRLLNIIEKLGVNWVRKNVSNLNFIKNLKGPCI